MYNTFYDLTYYGLAAGLALVLVATAVGTLLRRRELTDRRLRSAALGVASAAIGTLVALVVGVSLNAISSIVGDLVYQQVHFLIFYLGFGLVLYGIDRVAAANVASAPGPGAAARRLSSPLRLFAWGAFSASVLIACVFLLDPSTYTTAQAGGRERFAQQGVFYLPLFTVLVIGAVGLPAIALVDRARGAARRRLFWFGAYAGFALVGMLREATVIPSSGEPYVDLLVAFGPFTLAGICLFLAGRSSPRPLPVADPTPPVGQFVAPLQPPR